VTAPSFFNACTETFGDITSQQLAPESFERAKKVEHREESTVMKNKTALFVRSAKVPFA